MWLTVGCFRLQADSFCYDVVLSCLGVLVTLSAARDFPHRYVVNHSISGTLSNKAMVSQSEMLEHSFYQGLNLVQVIYLHTCRHIDRNLGLLAVTAPWLVRRRFPVNSFSQNWKTNTGQSLHEQRMYKIKKLQYLFYKHVILHGLNLSVYLNHWEVANLPQFRIFWICLNTAYVMEFYLQSLVRRKVLSQRFMLLLNGCLMGVSSLAAWPILRLVQWPVCVASLILNFIHRGHDVLNTLVIAGVWKLLKVYDG